MAQASLAEIGRELCCQRSLKCVLISCSSAQRDRQLALHAHRPRPWLPRSRHDDSDDGRNVRPSNLPPAHIPTMSVPATAQLHPDRLTDSTRTRLVKSLTILTHTSGALPDRIPPEVIEYVERSRNPDIYTREFVELVQRLNQKLKGRAEAYAQFRDALAREFAGAVPDAKDDVWCVVEATGGRRPAET